MLLSIAEAGNGLFYYIDNPENIPESFCDCLGGLLSVAAQVCTYAHVRGCGHAHIIPVAECEAEFHWRARSCVEQTCHFIQGHTERSWP